MRLGAWLTLFGLASQAGACSGGYPLPPTRCDEWCDATKGLSCETSYFPAECVAECERANLDVEACRGEFDAVVGCYRVTPEASERWCVWDQRPNPCDPQTEALTYCVGAQYFKSSDR